MTGDSEPMNGAVPTRGELARQLHDHRAEIRNQWSHINQIRETVAGLRSSIDSLGDNMEVHRRESREDVQEVRDSIDRLAERFGAAPPEHPASSVRSRVDQATGAVRFGRWLLGTALASASALAVWWDEFAAAVRAVFNVKGGGP